MWDDFKKQLPSYANDLKLNFSSVLESQDSDLTENQLMAIALASAYATKQPALVDFMEKYSKEKLDESTISAAKAAASIMAMNNIYYRFVHLVNDDEFKRLPAKLRMNVIGNPGIDKIDFELMSLAVSSINGCGMCMDSHSNTIHKSGKGKLAIQHVIRVAAVVNGLAQVIEIERS